MSDDLLVARAGHTLTVTFNRPSQRNAMTWEMYEGLAEACEQVDADPDLRVLVLRGSGSEAFVAGTDISQFTEFDGERGVQYEAQISEILTRVAHVDVPVVAAIEGFCIGGGLSIAAMADIRLCTPSSRFGVPIARTLGNCLSSSTLEALTQLLGRARTADILLTARLMPAEEALQSGFVSSITEAMDEDLDALTNRLAGNAPLTLWAIKEGMRRLHQGSRQPDDDIVRAIYDSRDFAAGVQAFLAKKKPVWVAR